MLLVLVNWCWILFCSFVTGFTMIRVVKRDVIKERETELYIVLGLVVLTVYAQFSSLAVKLGAAASLLLMMAVGVMFIAQFGAFKEYFRQWLGVKRGKRYLVLLLTGIVLLLYTSQSAIFYDTDLYHAQAIRWMEEYRIVKGLGNLHNRFAYNSAFLPLQSLFSWKFMGLQSLHTLNGFFCVVMSFFVIKTTILNNKQRLLTSDFLKLGILIYIFINLELIASPVTDIFPMLTVLYVLVKFCEYQEEKEIGNEKYLFLCFISVWAVTLKLSVAGLVLIALYPAWLLWKERQWKVFLFSAAAGLVIVMPFLIRNIYISGYLLYPYPFPDFFQVDWKMPASLAQYDKNEIMAWGRGLNDVLKYDWPFLQWFSIWFQRLDLYLQVLFGFNLVLTVASVGYSIFCIVKMAWKMECFLLLVCAVNLFIWLFTAPLPRYGMVYLLLMPCFAAELVTRNIKKRSYQAVITAVMVVFCSYHIIINLKYCYSYDLLVPIDYDMQPATKVEWNGQIVYLPAEGDRIGYHYFPSTPYLEKLMSIEMRGEALQDGFRHKEDYTGKKISTNGSVTD